MKTLDRRDSSSHALVVPDRILVATDLSDADYLVPWAIAQARACGAALTFVHVIPPAETLTRDPRAIPFEDSAAMASEVREALDAIARRVRDLGIPCEVEVVSGFPRDQIVTVARRINAGRILAGTHGRRHLSRLLLGSVAHEILRSAEIPVFTVGPNAREASSFGAPRRILHPVSLAAGFEQSTRLAVQFAEFYRADITLLHVLPPHVEFQRDSRRIVEWARSEMLRVVPDEAALWARVTAEIEAGDVVEEVLNAAVAMDADLIVLGVHHDASVSALPGNDAVYKIVARARSPVLSIRETLAPGEAADLHSL